MNDREKKYVVQYALKICWYLVLTFCKYVI